MKVVEINLCVILALINIAFYIGCFARQFLANRDHPKSLKKRDQYSIWQLIIRTKNIARNQSYILIYN